ncbi:rhodanese-like domain-containing protein [Antarcticirhabdus aurantiaca]|uniref:rhodanese-like domain-containing protein n=1 Tax=Antarcticirhabdus aurantiaca TaxID=2606717 RepID=UPI00131C5B96
MRGDRSGQCREPTAGRLRYLPSGYGIPGTQQLRAGDPALFAGGHVPDAINLPHGKIVRSKLERWGAETLFVIYCTGPHCNGAARGALRLAELGRPVKIKAGGITGWLDEGFELTRNGTE